MEFENDFKALIQDKFLKHIDDFLKYNRKGCMIKCGNVCVGNCEEYKFSVDEKYIIY